MIRVVKISPEQTNEPTTKERKTEDKQQDNAAIAATVAAVTPIHTKNNCTAVAALRQNTATLH